VDVKESELELKRFHEFSAQSERMEERERKMEERERRMEDRHQSMMESFAQLTNLLANQNVSNEPKGRGRGRGKGKKIQSPQPDLDVAAQQRLRSYVRDIGAGEDREAIAGPEAIPGPSRGSRASSRFTEDEDRPLRMPRVREPPPTPVTASQTIYISKIECFLNNTPIDHVEDKQNADECIQMFWRMYNFNGQLNTLQSNGISYDDFRKGFFFAVYDLSTSGKCGTNYVVPAIRVGHLRLR
jgi:hypothetical protein